MGWGGGGNGLGGHPSAQGTQWSHLAGGRGGGGWEHSRGRVRSCAGAPQGCAGVGAGRPAQSLSRQGEHPVTSRWPQSRQPSAAQRGPSPELGGGAGACLPLTPVSRRPRGRPAPEGCGPGVCLLRVKESVLPGGCSWALPAFLGSLEPSGGPFCGSSPPSPPLPHCLAFLTLCAWPPLWQVLFMSRAP